MGRLTRLRDRYAGSHTADPDVCPCLQLAQSSPWTPYMHATLKLPGGR